MSRKRLAYLLRAKFYNWIETIEDPKVKELAKVNGFITGGAIVSLLLGEKPKDYDIYFKTSEATLEVAKYYVGKWNEEHDKKAKVEDLGDRVRVYVPSAGIAEDPENFEDDEDTVDSVIPNAYKEDNPPEKKKTKKPYRPVFLSSNAITLSNGVQLVTRFFGEPEEVHKSFDFVHCTCWYHPHSGKLELPAKALEAIIMKQLVYTGSKYPLASIIRTRKFLKRGWKINAGQYLKMVFQLQDFDLRNPKVLEEQLTGVDFLFFRAVISAIQEKLQEHSETGGDNRLDSSYLLEVVEKVFDENK